MAIEYKKSITLTKTSTIYGHNSLDEGGFPADAGNAPVSQILNLSEEQTIDDLKKSITITIDADNTLLYHFNIGSDEIASFTVPSDKFLKSVDYDTSTKELIFTFITDTGENTVRVDMSSLVDTYTAGYGLSLSNNVFAIKLKGTETRLKSGADGLSVDLSDIISLIDTERQERQNTYTDLDARIVVIENKATAIDAAVATATAKANEASSSASLASGYATNAKTSESNAKSSATNASTYASQANTYKLDASNYATQASTYKADAQDYAEKALASSNNAKTSETNAKSSETSANTYSEQAKTYRDETEAFSKMPCYFRKQSYAVQASAGTTAITIPSEAQYRSGVDILFVHNKGVYLKEGTDYTKTDTGITLVNALTEETAIEIDIMRAVSTDSKDYDLLKGDKGDKGEDGLYSKSQLLDMIYPVGAIYTSLENVSPASTMGGTWIEVEDTFLYAQGSKAVGATGGEETHTLTEDEVPKHSHTRGSMNITGSFSSFDKSIFIGAGITTSGALVQSHQYEATLLFKGMDTRTDLKDRPNGFDFDASRTWTGSTSEFGSSGSHNNMPPYLVVYMWRRTA